MPETPPHDELHAGKREKRSTPRGGISGTNGISQDRAFKRLEKLALT
jgi:hypothetical protein